MENLEIISEIKMVRIRTAGRIQTSRRMFRKPTKRMAEEMVAEQSRGGRQKSWCGNDWCRTKGNED